MRLGWVKCSHCGRTMKTNAKIGNRIKCRFESCGKTFIVRNKLDERL